MNKGTVLKHKNMLNIIENLIDCNVHFPMKMYSLTYPLRRALMEHEIFHSAD